MNITEKEVIELASAVVQGVFSNPKIIDSIAYNSATTEEHATMITNSLTICRIALLRAGYTIYPIKTWKD